MRIRVSSQIRKLASRLGLLGSWESHPQEVPADLPPTRLKAPSANVGPHPAAPTATAHSLSAPLQ